MELTDALPAKCNLTTPEAKDPDVSYTIIFPFVVAPEMDGEEADICPFAMTPDVEFNPRTYEVALIVLKNVFDGDVNVIVTLGEVIVSNIKKVLAGNVLAPPYGLVNVLETLFTCKIVELTITFDSALFVLNPDPPSCNTIAGTPVPSAIRLYVQYLQ